MSNRSLLEFNHDNCPHTEAEYAALGRALAAYMRCADVDELPPGVVRKHYRHHSDPDPMARRAGVEASDEDVAALCDTTVWKTADLHPKATRRFRAALLSRGLELRKVGA